MAIRRRNCDRARQAHDAERHAAACIGPAHPALACMCFGWAMHNNVTLLLANQISQNSSLHLFQDGNLEIATKYSLKAKIRVRLVPPKMVPVRDSFLGPKWLIGCLPSA